MASPNNHLNNPKSMESSKNESKTGLDGNYDEQNRELESEDNVYEELNHLKVDDSAPSSALKSESGSGTAENKKIKEAESVIQEEDIGNEIEKRDVQLASASFAENEENEKTEALNIREDGESQDAPEDSQVSASTVEYPEESIAGVGGQSMPEELTTHLESADLPRITQVSARRYLLVARLNPPVYLELHDPPFVSTYTFPSSDPLRPSFSRRMSVTFIRYDFENGGFMVEFVISRGELQRSDGILASHYENISIDALLHRMLNDFSLAARFFRQQPDYIMIRDEVLES